MSLAHLGLLCVAGFLALAAVMTIAWRMQQNGCASSWIDAFWSLGVGLVAVLAALAPSETQGSRWRQALVVLLTAAWCLRLGVHMIRRARNGADDPRYGALQENWGAAASRNMFLFLQAQAAVGVVLVAAVALAASAPAPSLRARDWLGLAMLIAGVVGEAVADRQLRAFSLRAPGRNRVCDVGLWSWSRHPNYFFEWLFWLGFPIIAIDVGHQLSTGWASLAAPAVMYWTLARASGVPPLEAHMLRTRGQAFRDYQRRTSQFFPWPPRRPIRARD